jgi:hypothetical protein
MKMLVDMAAHTGFLTFARKIEPSDDERGRDLLEEAGGISKIEEADVEQVG